MMNEPLLYPADLGEPSIDGSAVHANGSVRIIGYGNCTAGVTFEMQTKVCRGLLGRCHWETRGGEGERREIWQYSQGMIADEATMPCQEGDHTYRIRMVKRWVGTVQSRGQGQGGGVIGTQAQEGSTEGPELKLTCR
jgi:hypothetical protein